MKTVAFKISGKPEDGDLAVVAYTTPRGGMSYAVYRIKGDNTHATLVKGRARTVTDPADTPTMIATGLAAAINKENGEFCQGQFHASVNGDLLIVACADAVDNVQFISQVQGSGKARIQQQ